jgi:adenylosuccinate lyase
MKKLFNYEVESRNLLLREGTAISNLDGRLWEEIGKYVGRFFGDEALVRARIAVEAKYLIALSKTGVVRKLSVKETTVLENLYKKIDKKVYDKIRKIEETVRHDVMSMTFVFKKLLKKERVLDDILEEGWTHWALTSEDIDNISRSVLLSNFIKNIYLPYYKKVILTFLEIIDETKNIVIPGKTHLQTATPTLLGKELSIYAVRLSEVYSKIKDFKITAKLMGSTGNLSAHKNSYPKIDWIRFSKNLVESFGLTANIFTTQIEPKNNLVELFSLIQLTNSIIIDISQDMRLMIGFGWLKQTVNQKEIGSSAMPQKVNPIDFENAQGNALLSNSILEGLIRQLPISWLQRDLVDKTIQRNSGLPFGYSTISLISLNKGLQRITPDKEKINKELESDWTIISEGIQTYLRSQKIPDAYEIIKEKTRGNKFNKEELELIIDGLNIAKDVKNKLKTITPQKYVGEGKRIIKLATNKINKIIR